MQSTIKQKHTTSFVIPCCNNANLQFYRWLCNKCQQASLTLATAECSKYNVLRTSTMKAHANSFGVFAADLLLKRYMHLPNCTCNKKSSGCLFFAGVQKRNEKVHITKKRFSCDELAKCFSTEKDSVNVVGTHHDAELVGRIDMFVNAFVTGNTNLAFLLTVQQAPQRVNFI